MYLYLMLTGKRICEIMNENINYRGYIISFWAKPIPVRKFDYDYQHNDYDLDDHRAGSAESIEACKLEIDELES